MTTTAYHIVAEKDLEGSRKEIEVEVPYATLESYRKETLKDMTARAELPGFRKGKAPQERVEKEIGEMAILEKAATALVHAVAYTVLADKKISFIGQPTVTLTTLAPGNPLRFNMILDIIPEITLPDYKKIAATENSKPRSLAKVTESDVEASWAQLKRMVRTQTKDQHQHEANVTGETSDAEVSKLLNIPDLAAFKVKLKKDLEIERLARERDKRLLGIMEKIVAETKLEIPGVLVERELDRMQSEFTEHLERTGSTLDVYLKDNKQSVGELRARWRSSAEKRAAFELLFPRIAKAERITAPSEEINQETKHLSEHYRDIDKETLRLYAERTLVRQKVLEFLGSNTKS